MFDLTPDDEHNLFSSLNRLPLLIRKGDRLVIQMLGDKPFYVTPKNAWKDVLDIGIQRDTTYPEEQKYLNNAAFIFSPLEFDVILLKESLNQDKHHY